MRTKTILLSSVVASFAAGAALPILVTRFSKTNPYYDIADERLLVVNKVTNAIDECYDGNTEAFKPPITSGNTRNGGKEAYQQFFSSGLSASEASDITKALHDFFITRAPSQSPCTVTENIAGLSPSDPYKWNIEYTGKESSATIDCYNLGTQDNRTVLLIMRERLHRPSDKKP